MQLEIRSQDEGTVAFSPLGYDCYCSLSTIFSTEEFISEVDSH